MMTTTRYDFTGSGYGTGQKIETADQYPAAFIDDQADAHRPVEICEGNFTREEARAFAVALLAALDVAP